MNGMNSVLNRAFSAYSKVPLKYMSFKKMPPKNLSRGISTVASAVTDLWRFDISIQISDTESWVQKSVVVDVIELTNAAVSHQDVARTLVNGEPVTRVLQVNVVAPVSPVGAAQACVVGSPRSQAS